MEGYGYLLQAGSLYRPHTPAAAFRACMEGLLPPEAFVHRAVSTQSLLEKPYQQEELERVLAQEQLDYDTILLLARVFRDLASSADMDTALFAAEGLNTLEKRYNDKIQLYRVLIEADPDPEYHKKLAFLYWEVAGMNREKRSIHNFYLREAFAQLRKIEESGSLDKSCGILMIKILMELDLYGQAREVLKKLDPTRADKDYRLLFSEIAFQQRNVGDCCDVIRDERFKEAQFKEGDVESLRDS